MYFIKELNNGIRVVIQKINDINSISIGIVVENGSTDESVDNNGISHFIEHMLFRGTNNQTSQEISKTIDKIGGNVNAFTSKENTCFYAQVLDYHLDIAIDLFSDMFLNPSFDEEDIEKEKSIIKEEINMYQDDPEDLVHELLNEIIYENTSLSNTILGKVENINSFNKKTLFSYFKQNYTGDKIIISLAGNIEINETYRKLNEKFGNISININNNKNSNFKIESTSNNKIKGIKKDIEQLNLCIGLPGPSIYDNDIYSYLILNNMLANNESSRLYQSIREEGLAYSLYSSITSYKYTGDISIYMGLNNSEIEKTLSILDKEIYLLSDKYIRDDELEIGKEQLKINYILESESCLSKMFENAKSISLFDRIESQDEILNKIDKINRLNMVEIIDRSFERESINVSYINNFDKKQLLETQVKKKIFRGV